MNHPDNHRLATPVLFLIYKRPQTTRKVFEQIKKARPLQLFVASDGFRSDSVEDSEKIRQCRQIATEIDWDCSLKTLFRNEHLGCKLAISQAIDWFFSYIEEGIILEDDCLPHYDFFPFCEELLKQYRQEERIMTISGNNFQFGSNRTPYSYYFSKYPHIWGWATWRRAWQLYDVRIRRWPEFRESELFLKMTQPDERAHWKRVFEETYHGKIDTWDYQWTFCCLMHHGLSILPEVNLVSNIGFGIDSTHTNKKSKFTAIPTEKMNFPLRHDCDILPNIEADNKTRRIWFRGRLRDRIYEKLQRIKALWAHS